MTVVVALTVALAAACSPDGKTAAGTTPSLAALRNAAGVVDHSPSAPPGGLPPGLSATPSWSVPFVGTPAALSGGFVGIVDTTGTTGHITIQVVDSDGSLRFGVLAAPLCSAFVVTTDGDRPLLVTMTATDPAQDAGEAHFFATARDAHTGQVLWDPTGVSGRWRGPGLVFGNEQRSVVGGTAAAIGTALDPVTGRTTVIGTTGADVLAATSTTVITGPRSGPGTVSGIDPRNGRPRWSSQDIVKPPGVAGTAQAGVTGVSGDRAVLTWSGTPSRAGLYDIDDGRLLTDLGTAPVAGLSWDPSSGTSLLTSAAGGTRAWLVDNTGRVRELDNPAWAGTPPTTLVDGVLYSDPGEQVSAYRSGDGALAARGPWQPPVPGTGPMRLVATDPLADSYVAVRVDAP